ncbi:MAG: rRNA maturation RNase YbeY [Spirochaetaceae bacterium]|jgi:probable rRNA maturation factor|nr:rRNA maturation RNase YbeY [Spirochaetaceae bacterium]
MTNTVYVSQEDREEPPPALARNIEAFALAVLGELGISGWELSILLCSDRFIRGLNAQFRRRDEPTDVLSFANGEEVPADGGGTVTLAGDIAVSLETMRRNCAAFGAAPNEELKRLIVHGILHLAGYDHGDSLGDTGDPPSPMLAVQETVLQKFHGEVILGDDDGD